MAKKRAGGGGEDDILDALHAAPPRAFVAERKRAVAALEAAGRDDEARAVAKLKRPSASVWAVNQLARRAPDAVAELLDLGATLRADERKLLRGGSAEDFMADARTARQKVASLARRAESFVEEAGQKATATLGRKIVQTLHAAIIADDETRARLQSGRLHEDLAAPSRFGSAGDLATTLAASLGATSSRTHAGRAGKSAATARKGAGAEHKSAAAHNAAAERKQAAAERKRAAAAVRDQRRAQAAARKHAATLERAAVAAARVVSERTRAVDKARAAVEHAESQLRGAKDALVDAETAAAAARRAADEAAAAAR